MHKNRFLPVILDMSQVIVALAIVRFVLMFRLPNALPQGTAGDQTEY